MATTSAPAPEETEKPKVSVSAKIAKAVQAVIAAEGGLAIALDGYRNVAKSETVRLGLEDKKALTAILFASGDTDARRISEIVGFVFPASDSARKELDKAMEKNAKTEDPKKRIAKPVILALQRDKTGKLTLEKAIADFKAGKKDERAPGGKTDQVEKGKKKTPKQIEEDLGNLIAAAMAFAKENGYDAADFNAVAEPLADEIFSDEEEEETEESED